MKSTQQIINFIRPCDLIFKKRFMYKISILSFFVIFFGLTNYAQKIITTTLSAPKVIYNESGVKISSKEVNCFDAKRNENTVYQLLVFENETATKVNLKAKHELYYDNICVTCPNEEYNFSYEIEANEKLEGTCDVDSHPSVKIWDHQVNGLYKQVLTDYKLQVVRF